MSRIFVVGLFVFVIMGCVPSQNLITDLKKSDQVVVTNSILETNITGDATFMDVEKNMSVSFAPIDTRDFDNLISRYRSNGSHLSITTRIEGISTADDSNKVAELDFLRSKLVEEELTIEEINVLINTIYEGTDPIENLFGYTSSDIYVNNDFEANNTNPFTHDDRYMTVVRLKIDNKSNTERTICDNEFRVISINTIYHPYLTNEILGLYPTGSIKHEALHTLLLKGCESIPVNSTIITHLVFPFFYNNSTLTIQYGQRTRDLVIDSDRTRKEYIFTRFKTISEVSDPNYIDYRVTTESSNSRKSRYHFLKINNSITYVGFENFFLHNDMDLNPTEIFTVKNSRNAVQVIRTPIKAEDFENGEIIVMETSE